MTAADDIAVAERQAQLDELAAEQAAKRAFDTTYNTTILETAKESIDRARSSGELVEKAATAIGGFYAAVIGVTFSVTEHPISARALMPVFFLAIAIVGSMVYLAFPTPSEGIARLVPTTARPERMRRQVERYLMMVKELNGRRVYFLRSSVVALGVAVVFLPAPFISDPQEAAATSETAEVTFPEPPDVESDADATVAAIRYQAEIDEAVAARTPATTAQENWPAWATFGLIAGLVLTFGIPFVVAAALGSKSASPGTGLPGLVVESED
jgi:hypothetical protein